MTPFRFSSAFPLSSYLVIEPLQKSLKYLYSPLPSLRGLLGHSRERFSLWYMLSGLSRYNQEGYNPPSPQKSETRASGDYTHFSMGYIPTKLVLDHHQRGMETGWTMNEQWRKHYEEKKKGGTPALSLIHI